MRTRVRFDLMAMMRGGAIFHVCTYSVARLNAGRELNSVNTLPAGVSLPFISTARASSTQL